MINLVVPKTTLSFSAALHVNVGRTPAEASTAAGSCDGNLSRFTATLESGRREIDESAGVQFRSVFVLMDDIILLCGTSAEISF